MALADEQFVSFTTFRRDGRAVSTPVWLVALPQGRFGFTTGAETGKAKRLRHTARVTLQGCDRRGGSLHGPVHDARAQLVSGGELDAIQAAVRAKYGAMAAMIGIGLTIAKRFGRGRAGSERVGVVIELDPASEAAAPA